MLQNNKNHNLPLLAKKATRWPQTGRGSDLQEPRRLSSTSKSWSEEVQGPRQLGMTSKIREFEITIVSDKKSRSPEEPVRLKCLLLLSQMIIKCLTMIIVFYKNSYLI